MEKSDEGTQSAPAPVASQDKAPLAALAEQSLLEQLALTKKELAALKGRTCEKCISMKVT